MKADETCYSALACQAFGPTVLELEGTGVTTVATHADPGGCACEDGINCAQSYTCNVSASVTVGAGWNSWKDSYQSTCYTMTNPPGSWYLGADGCGDSKEVEITFYQGATCTPQVGDLRIKILVGCGACAQRPCE